MIENLKWKFDIKVAELTNLVAKIEGYARQFIIPSVFEKIKEEFDKMSEEHSLNVDIYLKGKRGYGHIMYDEPESETIVGHIKSHGKNVCKMSSGDTFGTRSFKFNTNINAKNWLNRFVTPKFVEKKDKLSDSNLIKGDSKLWRCIQKVDRQYPWHSQCELFEVDKFYDIYLDLHSYSKSKQINFKEFCDTEYTSYTLTDFTLLDKCFQSIDEYKEERLVHNDIKEVDFAIEIAKDEIAVFERILNPRIDYIVSLNTGNLFNIKETEDFCKKVFKNHATALKESQSSYNLEMVKHYRSNIQKIKYETNSRTYPY